VRSPRHKLVNSICKGVRKDGGKCLAWKTAYGDGYCRAHMDQSETRQLANTMHLALTGLPMHRDIDSCPCLRNAEQIIAARDILAAARKMGMTL